MSSKETPTPVKGAPKKPEQAEEAPEVVKFSPEEEAVSRSPACNMELAIENEKELG